MKAKCKTLKLSILISSVSLILFSIFFFMNKCNENIWYEYIYNISHGLFGSSFVVFLVSITEYRVAKTQLLEKIWNESRKLNIQLHKIKPMNSYIDNDILINYINEWLFRQTEEDKLIFGNKHDAYDKLYNYLLEYHKESIKKIPKKEIKSYIDSLINSEREKILEKLEKIIDQYLSLNNYTFLEFNNLLGDVQFFTGKSEYLKLHQNIYEPLRNMYNDLKECVCYHFELYRNGEANRPDVLLSILFENQNKLFRTEKKKEKDHEWDTIYADFCDNIDDKIEEFRAKTIYKCEEEKPKRRKVGLGLIQLAKDENNKNLEYIKRLNEIKKYFENSTDLDSGDNRNSVDHGYMHPRFWTQESFENLIHDIAQISKYSKF